MADHKVVAHFPNLEFESPQAPEIGLHIREQLTTETNTLLPGSQHHKVAVAEDAHIKDGKILIQKMTTMWRDFEGKGTHIAMDIFSHTDDAEISQNLIQKFTSLAEKFGAQKIMLNGVRLLSRVGTLSIAEPAIEAAVNSVTGYRDAAEKIQPFVDSKDVSPETARDYAAAAAQTALINASPMAADLSLAAMPLAQWVHEHPEVPNKVLDELGLSQIREMQNLVTPGAQEMS